MVSRLVLVAVLASCGGGRSGPDAAPDADEHFLICERAGTSTVMGRGPKGPLDGAHVYVQALGGFCGTTLELVLTHADPYMYPPRPDNALMYVSAPGLGEMEPEWSGTFEVQIKSPDQSNPELGTLVVERGTAFQIQPSFLRGTLKVAGVVWQVDATFDVPYCSFSNCF